MSESDSFIREVSEEVRRERFSRLLRRYGWIGALVLVVVLLAVGAWEWRQQRDRAAAEQSGEVLRDAFLIEDPRGRADALDEAAEALAPAARAVARIAQAGALAEAGDREAAAAILASVSEDAQYLPVYRDLALLQRVALLGPVMDRTERFAAIETLSRPDGPFRALALEQRALARLEAGERDEARADLEAVLAEPALPEGLASRARQLLIAAGGVLPGTDRGLGVDVVPAPEDLPEALGNPVGDETLPLLPGADG